MPREPAAGAESHPHRRARILRLLLLVVAVALLIAPAFVLPLTPIASATELIFVGMIPTLIALLNGRRVALATALATAALVALVELVGPHPAAAGVLMLAVGLGIGALAVGGWQSIAAVAASWPAVLLVSGPVDLGTHGWISTPSAGVIVPALVALAGGLWTMLIGVIFLRALPSPQRSPLAPSLAAIYGVALGVVLGATAFAATAWWHETNAGWVLLTILVIARPGIHETRRRIITRSVGTIAGGVVAAAIAMLAPVQLVLSVAGLIALILAVVLQLTKANYAVYAFALTAAIVLLNSHGVDVLTVDIERVAFTIVGAFFAAIVVTILELLFNKRIRELNIHAASVAIPGDP